MEIRSYRDLDVWQKGMDLVVECYKQSSRFPAREAYGLRSQLERAAVSIPANIAEGRGRQHLGEFIQHLYIANGSLAELETHIQLAERLDYLDQGRAGVLLDRCAEVGRLINGLRKSLQKRKASSKPNT